MLFGRRGTVGYTSLKKKPTCKCWINIKQMIRLKFARLKNIEADHVNIALVRF